MDILLVIVQLAILGGIFYVFLIRPERKRRNEVNTLQNSLAKGDRVITAGGLRARIHALEEQTVTLITDEGVKLNFERQSISRKIEK